MTTQLRRSFFLPGPFFLVAGLLALPSCSPSGQRADESFNPSVKNPVWEFNQGPRVAVDSAHHNFHTIDGRYQTFAELLRRDGYQVRVFDDGFTAASLQDLEILVISNALSERNAAFEEWRLPIDPAFTPEEVASLVDWIQEGGALLLIADHMPMPAAAAPLAEALGVEFTNSYAVDEGHVAPRPPILFSLAESTLQAHSITRGRNPAEQVEQVATFTGQAFRGEATPLLVFGPGIVAVYPEVAGQLDEAVQRHPVQGWFQGAVLELGQGRVAVFGEAAMFSAQVTARGGNMGMNAEIASQNPQFLLNVMHWLSRVLD